MRQWKNKYNPFNSWKLMAHADKWKEFGDGIAPPPVLITIDTANACNLDCPHCNAHAVTGSGLYLDKRLNRPLAKFLKEWGVKTVCVAGGGEPLLNPTIITDLRQERLRVGVVTNGTLIDSWIDVLLQCDWVGVSVDASYARTYEQTKGYDKFASVIANIRQLASMMHSNMRIMRGATWGNNRGSGVFYKYLILPGNESEILQAAQLAKEIGCRGFHARPVGLPWDMLGNPPYKLDVAMVERQAVEAQELTDDDFGVYVVVHKFDEKLQKKNDFEKCWGCLMTAVITPHEDGFNVDLCCDRRGDGRLRLAEGLTEPEQIREIWSSPRHWEIHEAIKPLQCPRCTYGPHSKLYEQAIQTDNMAIDFI